MKPEKQIKSPDLDPGAPVPEQRDRALGHLFARLGPGRLEALEGVWHLCAEDLHGLALWRTRSPVDAEDALQNLFIRLARAAQDDRLKKVKKPFAYLLRMAHTSSIDVLRQRRRHEAEVPPPELVTAAPDRVAEARRLSGQLARLSDGQRSVLYLRYFVGMTFKEIGSVLGVPTFTAASRHRLALIRLRRMTGVEA